MNKTLRQRALLDALKHGSVSTQEDLQRVLRKRGFKVGQATLSRDIHDLNLSKTAHGYALSQGDNSAGLALPPVSRLVREFVLDIRSAQNLLVIKTIVGSAQPVAAALAPSPGTTPFLLFVRTRTKPGDWLAGSKKCSPRDFDR